MQLLYNMVVTKQHHVPRQFQPFFASSPVENLDCGRDKLFIIESLLKQASMEAWVWMWQEFDALDISQVIVNSSRLGKRDVLVWAKVLQIPEESIACLRTSSLPTFKSSWSY